MVPGRWFRYLLIPNSRRGSRIQTQTNPRQLTELESGRYEPNGQNKPIANKFSVFSILQQRTALKPGKLNRRAASLSRIQAKEGSRQGAVMCFRIYQMRVFSSTVTPVSGTGRAEVGSKPECGLESIRCGTSLATPFRIQAKATAFPPLIRSGRPTEEEVCRRTPLLYTASLDLNPRFKRRRFS